MPWSRKLDDSIFTHVSKRNHPLHRIEVRQATLALNHTSAWFNVSLYYSTLDEEGPLETFRQGRSQRGVTKSTETDRLVQACILDSTVKSDPVRLNKIKVEDIHVTSWPDK